MYFFNLSLNLNINGQKIGESYRDSGDSWLDLAYVLNMFLDNANKGHATNINLNAHTFNTYTELISRGVDLKTVIKMMTSPQAISMVNEVQNNPKIKNLLELASLEGKSYRDTIKKSTDINTDNISRDGLHDIFVKTNNRSAIIELDTLRNLASLDTRLPETTAEGIEMIDSILNIASGKRKGKDKIFQSAVDVSEIVSVAEEVDLITLKQKLF